MGWTKEGLRKGIRQYADKLGRPLTPEEEQTLDRLPYKDIQNVFNRLRARTLNTYGFGLEH